MKLYIGDIIFISGVLMIKFEIRSVHYYYYYVSFMAGSYVVEPSNSKAMLVQPVVLLILWISSLICKAIFNFKFLHCWPRLLFLFSTFSQLKTVSQNSCYPIFRSTHRIVGWVVLYTLFLLEKLNFYQLN